MKERAYARMWKLPKIAGPILGPLYGGESWFGSMVPLIFGSSHLLARLCAPPAASGCERQGQRVAVGVRVCHSRPGTSTCCSEPKHLYLASVSACMSEKGIAARPYASEVEEGKQDTKLSISMYVQAE